MMCPNYIPEKNTGYPLCDNKDCHETLTCCLSAHMNEAPYEK